MGASARCERLLYSLFPQEIFDPFDSRIRLNNQTCRHQRFTQQQRILRFTVFRVWDCLALDVGRWLLFSPRRCHPPSYEIAIRDVEGPICCRRRRGTVKSSVGIVPCSMTPQTCKRHAYGKSTGIPLPVVRVGALLLSLGRFGASFSTAPNVQVWDNVLAEEICEHLHDAGRKFGLGHKVFSRPLVRGCNPIERTLDSILSEIGDGSKYVEYWTRQEWRSIEAHADVDEFLAKSQDVAGNHNSSDFRYPTNGHVLYLKVGSAVRGPTCVFPGRRSGKDLLAPKQAESEKSGRVELLTVPAVPGRLLRFEGDFLHAVPRPADLWLLKFVKGASQYEPEHEWGRSVVLFNTWAEPPLNVPMDDSKSDNDIPCRCNERSKWGEREALSSSHSTEETCVEDHDTDNLVPAKIWLLGNLRRRGFEMRTIKLFAPPNLLDALQESTKVTRVFLSNKGG